MADTELLLAFERLDHTANSTNIFTATCDLIKTFDCHYDLPSVLSLANQLGIDILPISWMPGLGSVGQGATGQVYQSRVDLSTEFVFKRSLPSPGTDNSDLARYKAIISEMVILKHAPIRDHSNIIDLIGLGWDINLRDEVVWPVLIFPKASFGNLQQFLGTAEGEQISFQTRIEFCIDMLLGLLTMHSHNIIHGDLKPENVVVTKDQTGNPKLQLIDFGYSCFGSTENDIVRLPLSRPWTAPEHHWRGFFISAAKKMDIYAIGMVCAFIIFHSVWSFFVSRITEEEEKNFSEDFSRDHEHGVFDLLVDTVKKSKTTGYNLPHSLLDFFRCTLSLNASRRESQIPNLINTLNSASKTRNVLNIPSCQLQSINIIPHGVPILHNFLYAYDALHYLVREKIFTALELRANERQTCESCWALAVSNIAYCYRAGFGIDRDLEKAEYWFMKVKTAAKLLGKKPAELVTHKPIHDLIQSGSESVGFQNLLDRGLLDSTLSDELSQRVGLDKAVRKIELESNARAAEFGDMFPSALYLKLLLATLLLDSGRIDEALFIQSEMYYIHRQEEGPEDPNTLQVMALLAHTLKQIGYLDQASSLQEDHLAHTRKACGDEHPDTIHSLHELAKMKADMGEYDEAELLQAKVIEGNKRIYGDTHPKSITAMTTLGSIYCDQGKLSNAEALAKEVRAQSILASGPSDHNTLAVSKILSKAYALQRRFDEAAEEMTTIVRERKFQLGPSHPSTLTASVSLSSLQLHQGHLDEVEATIDPLLKECNRVLGFSNEATQLAYANSAAVKGKRKQWKLAEDVYLELIEAIIGIFGSETEKLILPMSNLAQIYHSSGDIKAAESWQRKSIIVGELFYKPATSAAATHPTMCTLYFNLAEILKLSNRLEEGEIYARKDSKKHKPGFVSDRTLVLNNQENLKVASEFFNELEQRKPILSGEEKRHFKLRKMSVDAMISYARYKESSNLAGIRYARDVWKALELQLKKENPNDTTEIVNAQMSYAKLCVSLPEHLAEGIDILSQRLNTVRAAHDDQNLKHVLDAERDLAAAMLKTEDPNRISKAKITLGQLCGLYDEILGPKATKSRECLYLYREAMRLINPHDSAISELEIEYDMRPYSGD